jgi:hypothetical protein
MIRPTAALLQDSGWLGRTIHAIASHAPAIVTDIRRAPVRDIVVVIDRSTSDLRRHGSPRIALNQTACSNARRARGRYDRYS